jgi:hypothetical protein
MPVSTGMLTAAAEAVSAPIGSGPEETDQNTSGLTQHGCYATPALPYASPYSNLRVQQLAGAQRVQLVAAGYDGYDVNVEQIGPQEYSIVLHVGNTVVLEPVPANCQNVETSPIAPNTSQFQFRSRQRLVVSTGQDPNIYTPTCTLTALGIGITEVTVTSF